MHSPVLFAPDGASVGALIAHAGHLDVQWWDATTGKASRTQHTGASAENLGVVELSPDHTQLLVSYVDPSHRDRSPANTSLQLWDVPTGKRLHTLTGHSYPLARALWSPDRTLLITSDNRDGRDPGLAGEHPTYDHPIVWDAATGAKLRTLDVLHGRLLAFAPDGKFVLTDDNASAHLCDPMTGHAIKKLALLSADLAHVAVAAASPDGGRLATSDGGQTVTTWDLRANPTDLTVKDWPGHQVHRLAWAPDHPALAVGFADGSIGVDDQGKRAVLPAYEGNAIGMEQLAWSPDGKSIASANSLNIVHVWDAASLQLLPFTLPHPAPITAMAYAPDGKTLVTGSQDSIPRIWDTSNGKLVSQLEANKSPIVSLAFAPDGKTLITAYQSHAAVIWDVATGSAVNGFANGSTMLDSIAYAPNGNWMVTVEEGLIITVRDAKTQIVYDSVRFYRRDNRNVGITKDSAFLVVSQPGSTEFVNVNTGQSAASLRSLPAMAAGYVWTPQGDVDFVGQDAVKARDYVECSFGQVQYPFELCEEQFLVPGLLHKVLAGEELEP